MGCLSSINASHSSPQITVKVTPVSEGSSPCDLLLCFTYLQCCIVSFIVLLLPADLQDRVEVNGANLKISSLALDDSGMYQCVAENKHGTIYASAELRVQGMNKLPLLSISVCLHERATSSSMLLSAFSLQFKPQTSG